MDYEKEETPLNLSLESIVQVLKKPPLFQGVEDGVFTLMRSAVKKFPVVKKGYTNSLTKLIDSPEKERSFMFKSFIRRYSNLFGDELYSILESLNNKNIEYILGYIQFEGNLKKHKKFLVQDGLDLEN
jgi:hypothetical protein